MHTVGVEEFRAIVERIAEKMEHSKDDLCALDLRIGDGDLGLSLATGFRAASQALTGADDQELSSAIVRCANAILRAAPSSMGTLLALGMLAGARAVEGRRHVDGSGLVRLLEAVSEAISARGKARLGDKTCLDALCPAIEEMRRCAREDACISQVLSAGLMGASRGVELTRGMQARVGRAARLGERTIGEVDPGALAVQLMVEAAVEAVTQVSAPSHGGVISGGDHRWSSRGAGRESLPS